MPQPQDFALLLLLSHLRKAPAERLQAALEAVRRGIAGTDAVVAERLVPAEEAGAYAEAARYLVAGGHLFACPNCKTQAVAPEGATRPCGRCGKAVIRGILPSPQAVLFDGALERQVRRLILEAVARDRTRGRVAEANRLRAEGKARVRPEAELAPPERAPQAAQATESRLGPYVLRQLVGRGSSSYVYRAEDPRDGRILALKVLYFREGESEAAVREKTARFQREAELASRLQHPNLVAVGPLERSDPWWFIPMAFVDGPTLEQLLDARRSASAAGSAPPAGTDARALAAAICEVARGLHFAHCQGVVHRDVNPRNVLFSSSGQPYLSDFGVAKPLDGGIALTGKRVVLGSVGYAAPERLESESKAGVASDVYSLGVVLFEVLTGRLPFPETDPGVLLPRILKEGPPSPRAVHPEISVALDAVTRKALAKDPARRQGSALDFAEELAGALAAADGTLAVAAAPVADHGSRSPAALAAALCVGLFVGSAGMDLLTAGRTESRDAESLVRVDASQTRLADAANEADFATARQDAVRSLDAARATLRGDDPRLHVRQARLAWLEGRLEECESSYARIPPGSPDRLEALVGRGLGAYFLAGRFEQAELREPRVAAAEAAFLDASNTAPDAYEGRLGGAMLVLMSGNADDAVESFRALVRDRPGRPEAGMMLGYALLRSGRPELAAREYDGLSPAPLRLPLVRVHRALALIDAMRERNEKGFAAAALELQAARLRAPDLPEGLLAEGILRHLRGDPTGALESLDRAIEVEPRSAEPHRWRVRAALRLGALEEALAALSRLVTLAPDDPAPLLARARAWRARGRREAAERDLRTLIDRFPESSQAGEARTLQNPK